MKRHATLLFCMALLPMNAWIALEANAQDPLKAAQTHAAAAKALAYEPGQDDLTPLSTKMWLIAS